MIVTAARADAYPGAMAVTPVRGEGVRALGLPVPPERMPLVRGGRPLKRWRYVGALSPELMLCVAEVAVGALRQRFWAIAEPDGRLVAGRAVLGPGGVDLEGGRVRVRAAAGRWVERSDSRGRVEIDLALDEAHGPPAVESVAPSGSRGYVWTRKRAGGRTSGSVVVDGRRRALDAEAVVDDTAGYHSRHTRWCWSAGVGRGSRGERIGWNLVEGVNDSPRGSERTVWVDGEPGEVRPVRFGDELAAIRFADGGELRLRPWATLAHRTRLGIVRSDYRQPFGAFEGELPGGIELREGFGVTERHDAHW